MSEEELVNFLYVIANAKGTYAKKYLEKCVELYTCIEKINPQYQMDLYSALKEKIKYFYQDDLKEKWRLIKMVIQATSDISWDNLTREEKIKRKLKRENKKIIEEKDKQLAEKDNRISYLEKQLNNRGKTTRIKHPYFRKTSNRYNF